ncbi:hypothetical protein IT399_03835 [Candidatus Nomurabacteria bacterium]|nr:hypothetical protein [Candidatus Nomurabacteria bacterium]
MKKEIKKTTEKYVTEKTFEKHMLAIAKSFARVNEVSDMILKEIRNIHEENKYFRHSVSDLSIDNLSSNRKIENLTTRVERLELKVK